MKLLLFHLNFCSSCGLETVGVGGTGRGAVVFGHRAKFL